MTSRAAPVVLLTGATGRIGAAVARAILSAGGRVAATVRRPWQVEKLRGDLLAGGAGGSALLVGVVAPRDAEAAAGFVKGANDALGPVTALIGAAGRLCAAAPGREPAGDLEDLLDANLWSNVTLARAVVPALRRRGSGLLAFVGAPEEAARLSVTCRASKGALRDYVDALAQEVAPAGLRCVCLAPPAELDAPTDDLASSLASLALGG